MLSAKEIKEIELLAKENRQNIVKMVHNAKSGHIGGSLSATDIVTVLFHKIMDKTDRFVLSKGHNSPLYYSVLSQKGVIPKEELMTFRKLGSRLQGHPTTKCPGIKVCTGSLGQGLSISCGIAIALKLNNDKSKVYTLLGDGELQEGQVWEAFMQGAHRNLSNLVAIVDRNCLQIDGSTEDVKAIGNVSEKIKAFGWYVIEINGHNINEIYSALEEAKKSDRPTAIVANTTKGKGVSFMENKAGWHGKAPNDEDFANAMKELEA